MVPFLIPSLATILPGIVFTGFSVIWMFMASEAPGGFWLFGSIFFFIGLGIIFGTPIWQLMRYKNTEYMITDRRLITQTGAIGLDTRFVDLDKIQEVYVQVGFIDTMYGTGSLYVTTASNVHVDRSGRSWRPSLAALKEPYDAQKLLQGAMEKSRTHRTAQE